MEGTGNPPRDENTESLPNICAREFWKLQMESSLWFFSLPPNILIYLHIIQSPLPLLEAHLTSKGESSRSRVSKRQGHIGGTGIKQHVRQLGLPTSGIQLEIS